MHSAVQAIPDPQKVAAKGKVTFDSTKRLSGIGAGDSLLIPNFLPEDTAKEILNNLLSSDQSEIEWNQLTNVKHGDNFPRLTAYQSDRNELGHIPAYRCADPQPWNGQYETNHFSPRVQHVKRQIEMRANHTFNWSRILCYRDGKDGMGFHSDKCLDIRAGSYIASLSLGQARDYELQPKSILKTQPGALVPQKITLRHNTLLLLGPETNRLYLHSVKKKKKGGSCKDGESMEPRVSITFRDLASWYVDGGALPGFYGQGTPYRNFDEYSTAKAQKDQIVWTGIAGFSCVAYFSTTKGSGPRRSPWLGLAAAGTAAALALLIAEWKKQRDWQREQSRLGRVYRQCNIQALTSDQARHLLLHGTDEELDFGASKAKSNSSVCGRDS